MLALCHVYVSSASLAAADTFGLVPHRSLGVTAAYRRVLQAIGER